MYHFFIVKGRTSIICIINVKNHNHIFKFIQFERFLGQHLTHFNLTKMKKYILVKKNIVFVQHNTTTRD